MKELAYKNNHGLVEVYGLSSDPDDVGYAYENASRIGLYIEEKQSEGGFPSCASLPLSPALARQVADKLLQWSDYIESNKEDQ